MHFYIALHTRHGHALPRQTDAVHIYVAVNIHNRFYILRRKKQILNIGIKSVKKADIILL